MFWSYASLATIYIIIRASAQRRRPTCVTLGKGSSTGNQWVVANNQRAGGGGGGGGGG